MMLDDYTAILSDATRPRKPHPEGVTTIVIHYTAGGPHAERAAKYIQPRSRKKSYHFVIGRDGKAIQTARLDECAWHSGGSLMPTAVDLARGPVDPDGGDRMVNDRSIGIALCNRGWAYGSKPDAFSGSHRNPLSHRRYWQPYTQAQYYAVTCVLCDLTEAMPTLRFIVGHEDIKHAYLPGVAGSKLDPGPAFAWDMIGVTIDETGLTRVKFDFEQDAYVADWRPGV